MAVNGLTFSFINIQIVTSLGAAITIVHIDCGHHCCGWSRRQQWRVLSRPVRRLLRHKIASFYISKTLYCRYWAGHGKPPPKVWGERLHSCLRQRQHSRLSAQPCPLRVRRGYPCDSIYRGIRGEVKSCILMMSLSWCVFAFWQWCLGDNNNGRHWLFKTDVSCKLGQSKIHAVLLH